MTGALAEARARFAEAGLPFPPVPPEDEPRVHAVAPWIYGTRADDPYLYEIDNFVLEVLRSFVPDYLLFGHSGRGANSWAMHYYLVRGPLCLFVQLMWGGAYGDDPEIPARMATVFAEIDELLVAMARAQDRYIERGVRIVGVLSDFHGSRYATVAPGVAPSDVQWTGVEGDALVPALRSLSRKRKVS